MDKGSRAGRRVPACARDIMELLRVLVLVKDCKLPPPYNRPFVSQGIPMKRLLPLVLFAALAAPVSAEPDAPVIAELMAGVTELGQVNGVALACGYPELVTKARAMMILRAPKTRRFGEAYETASTEAYTRQGTGGDACPEAVVLNLKLEMTDLRLKEIAAKAGVQ